MYYSASNSKLGWLNLSHSPTLPLPVTATRRVVKYQKISLSKGQMDIIINNNTQSSIACLTYMSRHALQKGTG